MLVYCCATFGMSAMAQPANPVSDTRLSEDIQRSVAQLEEVRQWLWKNPPDGTNRVARREKMGVIQQACDPLAPSVFGAYVSSWNKAEDRATELEDQHAALHYLRAATMHAVESIQRTRVERGMAIWHLYNMGYVFKTRHVCFGADLKFRDAEQLAGELDFLLITHEHGDHWSEALVKAMIRKRKPVIMRSVMAKEFKGALAVAQPAEMNFGNARVKVDVGSHDVADPDNPNMLMFQVDCGTEPDMFTVYHCGDGNNLGKIQPDRHVDVFIPHIKVGLPVTRAVDLLKPGITLASHVLELRHAKDRSRWSYEFAFNVIKDIPPRDAVIMTWGERLLLPGTVLAKNAE